MKLQDLVQSMRPAPEMQPIATPIPLKVYPTNRVYSAEEFSGRSAEMYPEYQNLISSGVVPKPESHFNGCPVTLRPDITNTFGQYPPSVYPMLTAQDYIDYYGMLHSGPMTLGGETNPWYLNRHPAFLSPGFSAPETLLYNFYRKPKRMRTAFSPAQLLELEHAFQRNHYVVGNERRQLANALNLTETQVKVWFQNRRTKHKRLKQDDEITCSSKIKDICDTQENILSSEEETAFPELNEKELNEEDCSLWNSSDANELDTSNRSFSLNCIR